MNTTFRFATVTAALFIAVSGAAQAAPETPRVDAHQANQAQRIQQGVASGELTKREATALRVEQRGIRAEERAFKADGVVTPVERKQLRRDQREASRHIYKKKHNARKVS